ncbi:hypothetical protein; putative signal peptide [Frankia alni ACN14a]|uniref:Uncharacterized protein n=1 Tax=Frankia alni (strain DSM 45986 / CECT 9034 / ACN14a) TaxID=326424 RepID=Q0RDR9_FRAAA|nr:hypothetical protein; putative signal peptide [Frankia alni ACN14a]
MGLGGLALADAVGVTACTTTVSRSTASNGGLGAPDIAAARGAVVRATALATAYRSAAGRHPSLRFLFDPLRAHHELAASTLGAQIPAAVTTIPTASAPTGPTPTRLTPTTHAPTTHAPTGAAATAAVDESARARAATLASLRAAESGATAAARTDSLRVSGVLAPLLASLHAAGVAQVELLDLYSARVGAGQPAETAGGVGGLAGVGLGGVGVGSAG